MFKLNQQIFKHRTIHPLAAAFGHAFSCPAGCGNPFPGAERLGIHPGPVSRPAVGRPLGDVDLLVQPQKFPEAVRLLLDFGYQPGSRHPRYGYDRKSSYTPYELAFTNAAGVSIDLHRHIFPTYWSQAAFPIDMDVVWDSRQPFTDWGGNVLERLSPELNFLHLITHIPAMVCWIRIRNPIGILFV